MNVCRFALHCVNESVCVSRTCHVEDGLESESEPADLERVILLDAVLQHFDAAPVLVRERRVVVSEQRRTLTFAGSMKLHCSKTITREK